ncbi:MULTISPECIES: hypothetical protein [Thalassospira]|jgi:hypothetical protein|uniref:Oxidoreductase molybdopterin-binding domain-containing protein n=1 Tax=Thalassospira xiamenensis TaxID=220697 RepID=A0ABR5XZ82_9PROT|nr:MULTISPECIES: hypothetical protein [Thalassospira]PXX34116.1 hypothetical protein C7967_102171 [Thalassospira sp. 11-3]QPL35485.1 hypothetical protein IT971_20695 [Thalassospira sp. B30-1]KZD01837.1 hypothetical protein AUP40_03080 [Thalassospira xiamenensis]KZD11322.1 hypothetical protein AUP45_08670 [Thalassospira xiamenensis]MAB32506.1 hypothetical protein [Thalassospira sp.]|tara:strand:+ start:1945 stop:2427 length:483 start_codon:yes stop_codon:yes gene_type:complete
MMMKTIIKFTMALCVIGFLSTENARAAGKLILSNTGGETVTVSFDELTKLPSTEFYTSTPWTDGVQKFQGVDFDVLFDTYGITADTVRVSALNDYSVMVPAGVLRRDNAILVYRLNDAEMSVRDKGPFWVVFPYDSDTRFQTDTYWSYSVWQVKSIDGQN